MHPHSYLSMSTYHICVFVLALDRVYAYFKSPHIAFYQGINLRHYFFYTFSKVTFEMAKVLNKQIYILV